MMQKPIQIGQQYFFRTETRGEPLHGVFTINADEVVATLYSFDQPISLGNETPFILRLQDNRIASLYQTSSLPHTQLYGPKGASYSHRVISNVVIIGKDAWNATDVIRGVQFKIEHAERLMRHIKKNEAIAEFNNMPDLTLFELNGSGFKVKVSYILSGTMSSNRATKVGVLYSVEFEEPADLDSYWRLVVGIEQFVSAVVAVRLVASEIQLSRLSHAELQKAGNDAKYWRPHDVWYSGRSTTPNGDLDLSNPFVNACDDRNRDCLVEALRVWLERRDKWQNATQLMMTAFSLNTTLSNDRLLNACKWLEEIPGAQSATAVTTDDIDKIASVAAAEADRLGHKNYKNRIAGAIRGQVKKESNKERFERLSSAVRVRFGNHALAANAVSYLEDAMKFRGKVAHTAFEPADKKEFLDFAKALYTLEALCYLLTIRDLPMTDEGAQRALGTYIVNRHIRPLK